MASGQGGAAAAPQSHVLASGPHWSPGLSLYQHQQQQQQQHLTARSLDRALEDAVCSGILNLSGRKLRDYPGLSYDLTDTTHADLSKNRLSEIPPDVCLFAPLESLNLYHNCIKFIPEGIINLQMLTYLDISRNLLSVLPKFLFNLPLKVLLVSNNKLVSIPEEIGRAKDLMELDISCNEIQLLPAQVGRLQALRELNIRRNCLELLPEELADLPLTHLDFSCNKITEIPAAYRKLRQLQHIVLDNNPMQSPPAQICLKGKVHIFKYLNMLACRAEKKPDTLDLPTLGKRCLPQPLTDSIEDFYPGKTHGPDSGIGSDNGEKRLSTTEELEKVLNLSQQSKERESWREESGSDKELLCEEEDEELREVLDLRKIAVQLLQQEQQNRRRSLICRAESLIHRRRVTGRAHRFLSHSGNSSSKPRPPAQAARSASLDEGSSGASVLTGQVAAVLLTLLCELVPLVSDVCPPPQPPSSCSFDGSLKSDRSDSETKWPEVLPVLHQSDERRRNKYLRKDYLKHKCQSARRSSSVDDCEDGLRNSDFSTTLTVFGLKPRSAFTRGSRQDFSANDPSFTMRRKMENLMEEIEQIGLLRQNIESRLKVLLPDDVGAALMDGVVLCHLANHISPRSVSSIHVPSPAVPKLSMAKCRRNVENFLDACKKMGVPQDQLCLPHHILEQRGLVKVGATVQALLDLPATQLSSI
ncbi:leucine-rich repeat and calponin homology domain-containing protein 2 isoform 5-T5 [Synchiropus picturatus]